jgi:hypothetical protein
MIFAPIGTAKQRNYQNDGQDDLIAMMAKKHRPLLTRGAERYASLLL